MKKFFTTILSLLIVFALSAQVVTKTGTETGIFKSASNVSVKTLTDKAVGDTLFYFDGSFFYLQDADEADFDFLNEDLDLNTPAQTGYDSDWMFFYSLDPADLFPGDVDSAFFMGASSWFVPAGQADNWFSYGPITIPSTGAIIRWNVRCNPAYRDGYRILVSSTGMENYTDFTEPPIFVRTDMFPSNTEATDTVWTQVSADIPYYYAGTRIYIAMHHNADDMDMLYFDQVSIVEDDLNPGISEQESVNILENYPNPADDYTTISFNVSTSGNAVFTLYDMTGRILKTQDFGYVSSGLNKIQINTETLNSGVYFYTVTLNENTSRLNKMIVR